MADREGAQLVAVLDSGEGLGFLSPLLFDFAFFLAVGMA